MFERCDISSVGGPGGHQDDRDESAVEHWTEREIDKMAFKDARPGQRFGELLRQIGDGMGACQDWANMKAACRFFANERVLVYAHNEDRVIDACARGPGSAMIALREG